MNYPQTSYDNNSVNSECIGCYWHRCRNNRKTVEYILTDGQSKCKCILPVYCMSTKEYI